VLLNLYRCINLAQGTVRNFGIGGASNTKWDGTRPAALEVGHRNLITCDGCTINDQPVVRFRTTNDTEKVARVIVRGTTMNSGRALGGEIVTCNEGGYAGQTVFENCQRNLENFSGSVGVLGGPGNSNTHRDDTEDSNSNVINGYDAWPSANLDDFYDANAFTGA